VPRRPLEYGELLALLGELAARMDAATDAPIELRIVGGAAIAAAYNADRSLTDDVDFLESTDVNVVLAAAAEVASSHDLDASWLNFDVRQYAPDPVYPAPTWNLLIEHGRTRVLVGNPRLLLAMKIHGDRPNRDFRDIDVLLSECGITTFEAALACFEEHYTADVIKPRTEAYLRSKFDDDTEPR
jgi:hypothetical protein